MSLTGHSHPAKEDQFRSREPTPDSAIRHSTTSNAWTRSDLNRHHPPCKGGVFPVNTTGPGPRCGRTVGSCIQTDPTRIECARKDSNLRSPACRAGALPTELRTRVREAGGSTGGVGNVDPKALAAFALLTGRAEEGPVQAGISFNPAFDRLTSRRGSPGIRTQTVRDLDALPLPCWGREPDAGSFTIRPLERADVAQGSSNPQSLRRDSNPGPQHGKLRCCHYTTKTYRFLGFCLGRPQEPPAASHLCWKVARFRPELRRDI